MTFKAFAVARFMATSLTSVGATYAVSDIFKLAKPTNRNVVVKTLAGFGAFVIADMVGEMAANHVGGFCDEMLAAYKTNKILTSIRKRLTK